MPTVMIVKSSGRRRDFSGKSDFYWFFRQAGEGLSYAGELVESGAWARAQIVDQDSVPDRKAVRSRHNREDE